MDPIISELLKMCRENEFDILQANELIKQIDVNQIFQKPYWETSTTLLQEAASSTNLKMTELLLKNGADPKMIVDDDNPLWNLQYPVYDGEISEDEKEESDLADEDNLRIAQLLLEYGADPCLTLDNENLFSYVLLMIFNDDDFYPHLLDYRSRFFILLIAYGGKDDYVTPKILRPMDKTKLLEYRFNRVPVGDGFFLTGEILDENEEIIAEV